MPPRRSARVAAVVERQTSALAPLPLVLVLAIFALLPVDQLLRCLEVCRGWRAVLSDASLWLRLDFRSASGLAREALDGLLRAAAARANGQLYALDVSGVDITHEALLAVVRANAGTLRELTNFCPEARENARFLPFATAEDVLRAAPLLRAFTADVTCGSVEAARRLLQNEGLFRPMRVHHLEVSAINADEAEVLALAAYVAACETLTRLVLDSVPLRTAAALDAVVTAALARRLSAVVLWWCGLTAASVPALVRLLGGGALRALTVGSVEWLLDAPAAVLLGAALRAHTALTSLTLWDMSFWHDDATVSALLGALTAHPSLRTLNVFQYGALGPRVAATLGALVAANAPALQELKISYFDARATDLAPLLDALPRNTHLRSLRCACGGPTNAFVREQLMPAVRANASLRVLRLNLTTDEEDKAEGSEEAHALLRQAEALVAARSAAP
jgi:hypothetical protein